MVDVVQGEGRPLRFRGNSKDRVLKGDTCAMADTRCQKRGDWACFDGMNRFHVVTKVLSGERRAVCIALQCPPQPRKEPKEPTEQPTEQPTATPPPPPLRIL